MSALKKPRRIKIEPNLYKVGASYYFIKGDLERSLGRLANDTVARRYKKVFEAQLTSIGKKAFDFRVGELFPKYLKVRENDMHGLIQGREKISPRTYKNIEWMWEKHLKGYFARRRLSDVDDPMWNDYCKTKTGDLSQHRKVLSPFLVWCKVEGYTNIGLVMQIPKVARRRRRILTPEELLMVIENSKGKLLLFISLYLFMAIRWTEIQKLAWSSVDLNDLAPVLIVQSETSRTRTGRAVPINKFVHNLLIAERERQTVEFNGKASPWVFPKRGDYRSHAGDSFMRKSFATMLENAELTNVTPHDLRATFEHYAHLRADFTDTQRERMAGASIATQKSRYVHTIQAKFLKGLEDVVEFDGLTEAMDKQIKSTT